MVSALVLYLRRPDPGKLPHSLLLLRDQIPSISRHSGRTHRTGADRAVNSASSAACRARYLFLRGVSARRRQSRSPLWRGTGGNRTVDTGVAGHQLPLFDAHLHTLNSILKILPEETAAGAIEANPGGRAQQRPLRPRCCQASSGAAGSVSAAPPGMTRMCHALVGTYLSALRSFSKAWR